MMYFPDIHKASRWNQVGEFEGVALVTPLINLACGLGYTHECGRFQDAGEAANFFSFKLHDTRGNGKKSVITAAVNVFTGAEFRAALAHDNTASCGIAAMSNFDAQSFGLRFSP